MMWTLQSDGNRFMVPFETTSGVSVKLIYPGVGDIGKACHAIEFDRPLNLEGLREFAGWLTVQCGWRDIETLPPDEDMLLLAKTADGRRMIYRTAVLRSALRPDTPAHLRFPAIAWMPVPD